MARNEGYAVGLDIGTTKICCVVAALRPANQVQLVGLGEAPSRGLRKGVVVNLDATVESIKSALDKAELMALIEDYRQGLVPLIVPLTLLKHHLRRPSVPEWVHKQVYLNPYPKELMLRNHV